MAPNRDTISHMWAHYFSLLKGPGGTAGSRVSQSLCTTKCSWSATRQKVKHPPWLQHGKVLCKPCLPTLHSDLVRLSSRRSHPCTCSKAPVPRWSRDRASVLRPVFQSQPVLAKPARPKTHWKQPQKEAEKASKLDWKTVAFWHESSALWSECEESSKPAPPNHHSEPPVCRFPGFPSARPPFDKSPPLFGKRKLTPFSTSLPSQLQLESGAWGGTSRNRALTT